jgi:paraquat-inducible protein A
VLKHNGLAAVTSVLAAGVLWISMRFPFITMIKLGDVRSFSLPGGIYELYKGGDWFLALVLLSFSVVFPFAKLLCLLLATTSLLPFSPRARRVLHKLADITGKYSMLDVLVVAITIVVVKFHAIAEVHARPGTYMFCAAVGLSILAGTFVNHARFSSHKANHE